MFDWISCDGFFGVFVFNKYRPLTPDAESAFEIMQEIEAACKIKFTAIVNNSNLGESTTAEDVINSVDSAEELSKLTGWINSTVI